MRHTTVRQWLDNNVMADPNSGCWLWTAALNENGYGRFMFGGRRGERVYAHRAAWVEANGPIPAGLFVCHKCDVRACVNPDHLFLGTAADNTADMMQKGRQRAVKKLTDEQIAAIRSDNSVQEAIARKFGVSQCYVSEIKSFKYRVAA